MKGLERFSIAHLANRSARKLSGGEAQRASLARALATWPEVIFLDEPFAALDPPTRQSIINDMEKIFRETGIAVVLVTHDESEALRLSDRIMVINGGRIVQTGIPEEIINRPATQFVARFVNMENMIPGTVMRNENGRVMISIPGGAIEAMGDWSPGKKVICGIRPENVDIHIDPDELLKNYENFFRGKIKDIIPSGPSLKVILECGFPVTAYAPRRAFPDFKLARDKLITVSFQAADVHLLPDES